jgi:signal transduction histidine kinase
LIPLILFACTFALITAIIAHYWLVGPFRRLVTMAQAIGRGDFSQRLGFERTDEIGKLAREMDLMCDQLAAAKHAAESHVVALDQLRHSDRLETLGRFATSMAHELGNPLNVIELRAQLMSSGELVTLQQAQQSAIVILEQTRRMTRIIQEVLSFARTQPASICQLDLVSVLRKAIVLSDHISKQFRVNVTLELHEPTIEIEGDPDKLLQLLVNLVANGMQAMPGGGTLSINTGEVLRAHLDEDPQVTFQRYAYLDICDHGVGIEAQSVPRVFEPFFSTKGAEGTGLGLSVAQGIAREHGGWIEVTSKVAHGSTFRVHLPYGESHGAGP